MVRVQQGLIGMLGFFVTFAVGGGVTPAGATPLGDVSNAINGMLTDVTAIAVPLAILIGGLTVALMYLRGGIRAVGKTGNKVG